MGKNNNKKIKFVNNKNKILLIKNKIIKIY